MVTLVANDRSDLKKLRPHLCEEQKKSLRTV